MDLAWAWISMIREYEKQPAGVNFTLTYTGGRTVARGDAIDRAAL